MSNPNFIRGQPMLIAAALESVGAATAALHEYYMKIPATKLKNRIPILFKRNHFFRFVNPEVFNVGFGNIYELLNFDALDVSIIRCYTLLMLMETKQKGLPIGFLDPEVMILSTSRVDKSYMVDYVRKAFRSFVKDEFIMFAHNPGDHWLLVVLIPKWGKCHQQRSGNERGFYTAHRMIVAFGLLDVIRLGIKCSVVFTGDIFLTGQLGGQQQTCVIDVLI
uniref:Ubiquitin-like protease family profile domain-containing protein n=1 Tax=Oryza brachyantha TaxID=4533 RepID=J3MSK9_ORYBR